MLLGYSLGLACKNAERKKKKNGCESIKDKDRREKHILLPFYSSSFPHLDVDHGELLYKFVTDHS